MTTTEIVQRQERYGTASEWSTANTVLLMAEIGIESDTGKGKIGDGATAWSSLEYSILPDMPGELAAKLANAPAKNTQTTDFDFALTDAAGLLVVANKATALAGTLKQNSAMASSWPADSVIRFINRNDGILTITAGSGVTITGTPLTFGKGKGGALIWLAANTWVCVPFSSGDAPAVISGTTGSPATSSITGYAQTSWTGNGTFTVATAGLATLEISAGGAAGSSSRSGGAGGQIRITVWLPVGTYTVVVGAGGASPGADGGQSYVTATGFALVALGGGGFNNGATRFVGSAAGTFTNNTPGQGYPSDGSNYGAGGAGGPGVVDAGGPGVAWLDGVTRGVGGTKSSGGAGAANTGNGGQGDSNDNGGSGVVTLSLAA